MKMMAQDRVDTVRAARQLDNRAMHAMAADRVSGMNDIYKQTLGKEESKSANEAVGWS